jgi:hypothetical protein
MRHTPLFPPDAARSGAANKIKGELNGSPILLSESLISTDYRITLIMPWSVATSTIDEYTLLLF